MNGRQPSTLRFDKGSAIMFIGPMLTEFFHLIHQIHTEADLKELMLEVTRQLGFERFALVSHVDLVTASHEAVAISNYHEDWLGRIFSQRYYIDDPVHAASTGLVTPFAWHAIRRLILLSARQERILSEGASFGLRDGVTMPVHSPGEYRGTCSFATSRSVMMTPHLRGATQILASYAFETARMLVRARLGLQQKPRIIPQLSSRQIDCIGLVAEGWGDTQIAARLGLSEATVHQHICEGMRRYGAFKRHVLVIRALFDGQICFPQLRRIVSRR